MDGTIPFEHLGNEYSCVPDSCPSAQNRLLSALPADIQEGLAHDLQPVHLERGEVLNGSGQCLRHAYFPTDSIVSLICELDDGAGLEIAAVGNEGLVGIALLTGGKTMPYRAVVQSAGAALRIRAETLVREFENGGALRNLLLRYTQALWTQAAQSTACNRHHLVEQRVCRCLLSSMDRLPSNELEMTHEVIANSLGVRREGVTQAARGLQAAGLIHYRRGKITVLDRLKLEARACECYAVVKEEFKRLLPRRTRVSAR